MWIIGQISSSKEQAEMTNLTQPHLSYHCANASIHFHYSLVVETPVCRLHVYSN